MNKRDFDQLYHLLRVASNDAAKGDINHKTALTSVEVGGVVYGIARHLLAGGDYLALVKFSCYYGENFLVAPTIKAIRKTGWPFTRVVEFGAGMSWLGRGVAASFGLLPTMFVDKRAWTLIDTVADLEAENDRRKVLNRMAAGDLIVMSDFLHCVENPKEIIEAFAGWRMAVLEYCPTDSEYRESYSEQITRHGAKPIVAEEYAEMFAPRYMDVVDLNPYILILANREKN